MAATLSITETAIFTAMNAVLQTFGLVNAAGLAIPIIKGQVNRVPEPGQPDFAIMWPLMRDRLATNVDTTIDSQVTGSIASNVLTVTHVILGSVLIGQALYGAGITVGCSVVKQLGGTGGGVGTYSTTTTTDVGSETIYCGTNTLMQPTEFTAQIDIHGPSSADNAQRVTTLWRDEYAILGFQEIGAGIVPLYTSDPRQLAFTNAEQQYEDRWSVDLCMQINPVVTVTQQFADQLVATLYSVETVF
jgi:hypothetical protein